MDPAVARAAEASSILCAFGISNLFFPRCSLNVDSTRANIRFVFCGFLFSKILPVIPCYIIRRKWQGDPNILIDRFDVRAHLDYIPETKVDLNDSGSARCYAAGATMDVEELQCEYERYRILVLNEFERGRL
ncbi:unnamed protein product [Gongylonema pulchrum]|uniref:DRY_EERY domain-containing protein n=1 Tax=Gongylonema pulchrum TaxID=637853 RepID=A0A183ECN7_9BILA|nr:unnamed protein product [Gongylonema pulchrum]